MVTVRSRFGGSVASERHCTLTSRALGGFAGRDVQARDGLRSMSEQGLVGTILDGSYRLTRLMGEGGMGAVYEGLQLRLNKRVAVKLMSRDLSANQEALARFRREAELTSQLGHPHIVNVFDFGASPTGEPYLVMEFLAGEDLEQRLRRLGRLPLPEALRICKQVASALAATHAKGIIHRDLKPANVFLLKLEGDADFVKVLDFGISKAKAAVTKLTRASQIMGTPHYMAPEQATGNVDEIDARTDEWSLACIVWEMLAGRGPFAGEDVAALLYQVVHQEPGPLAAKVPGLPARVEEVLRRGISKKQAERFPSVATFAAAFEAAATERALPVEKNPSVPAAPPTGAKETLAFGPPQPLKPEHDAPFTPPAEVAATALIGSSVEPRGPEAPSAEPTAFRTSSKTPMPTTFSNAATEFEAPARFVGRIKPVWVLGAGGAVLLVLLVAVLGARRSGKGDQSTASQGVAAGAPVLGAPVEGQNPVRPSITPIRPPPTAIPAPELPVPTAPPPEERIRPNRKVAAAQAAGERTPEAAAVVSQPAASTEGAAPARRGPQPRANPFTESPGTSDREAPKAENPSAKPRKSFVDDLGPSPIADTAARSDSNPPKTVKPSAKAKGSFVDEL